MYLANIWNNEYEITYVINRNFRLIVCMFPFFFPILYVRHYSNKLNYTMGKIIVEFHVLIKFSFAIVILYLNLDRLALCCWVCIYSLVETILIYFRSNIFV